jgi:S1-C subfamily serine protease
MKKLASILLIVLTLPGCTVADASYSAPDTVVITEATTQEAITDEPELTDEQIEELRESCAMLYAENDKEIAQGSGVYIGKNTVLTAYHVVNGYDKIWADSATFKVIDYHKTIDIALLQSSVETEPVKIGDSSKLMKGSKLIIISAPQGNEDTVTYTEVLDVRGSKFLAKATLGGGASGGAVFDSGGYLVGILVAAETGESKEEKQFIVPINLIQKALQ